MGYGAQILSPAANGLLVKGDPREISLDLFVDKREAVLAAGMSREDLGCVKAAICVDMSEESSIGLAKEFERIFRSLGGEIVSTRPLKNGWPGMGETVEEFKRSGAEIIYAPVLGHQLARLAISCKALEYEGPILTTKAAAHSDMIKEAGPASEGIIAALNSESGYELTDKGKRFREEYAKAFGNAVERWAILAAESYFRIIEAMESCGSDDHGRAQSELARENRGEGNDWALVRYNHGESDGKSIIVSKGKFVPMNNPSSKKLDRLRAAKAKVLPTAGALRIEEPALTR